MEARAVIPLKLSTKDFTLWRHPSVLEAEARHVAQAPREWLWKFIDRPVKIDDSAFIVTADLATDDGVRHVALKRFREKSIWKALLSPLRTCRAMRCWQRAEALRAVGVATPEPLLAIQPRRLEEQGTCYLATEWIAAAENLHLYLWRIAGDMALRNHKADQCAEALGRMLGRLHRAGLRHRDLKAANLLIQERGDSIVPWLVDLEGMKNGDIAHLPERPEGCRASLSDVPVFHAPSLFVRAQDLARLATGMAAHPWIGRSVFARFLRAYGAQNSLTIAERRLLRAAVERFAEKIIGRKKLRGQQVL
jgi:tRNA A-37 threonylcarbamoyl transferase component Bud32